MGPSPPGLSDVGPANAPAPSAPAHDSPRLGRYPVRLPRLRDPRLHVATVTTTLQVLGQTVFDFPLSIAQILISIGTCAVIDLTVAFRRERVIAWPASAMLTGNGIALIMRVPGTEHGDWWSLNGWWVFMGTALLAMGSKYLIRSHGRHVFNPSNFALVLAFVLLGESRADPQVLWWGPLSPGLVLAFAVILAGSVLITRRVGQGHSALSFWGAFALGVAVIALTGHSITANWSVDPIAGWDYWWLLVTSPEVLVFVFYMLTDPKTAPTGRVAQSLYGVGIAVVSSLILATQSGEFGTKVGILAGLVVLCLFVRAIERRTPAAGGDEDVVSGWLRAPGPRLTRRATVSLVGLAWLATLGVLGGQFGVDAPEAVDLSRRDEVILDESALPSVSVDDDLPGSSAVLDEETAARMGAGLALSLEIESLAIAEDDLELARNGLTGIRLRQTSAAMELGGAQPTERRYETMTATLFRPDAGPQTPPELAVRARGVASVAGADTPFDSTFTLAVIDGEYLVSNEFDADGAPVGLQVSMNPDAIEPAVASDPEPANREQLDGLSLVDVTDDAGLAVTRSAESLREGPAAISGGVAVGDYDRDGDEDLFLTRVGGPNALFRNDGGRFTDVSAPSGIAALPNAGGSTGASFVDVDGDQHLDLIVLGLGSTPNRLLRGGPGGAFTDVSEQWNFPQTPSGDPDAATYSLAVADYDRDGLLDVFIAEANPYATRERLRDLGVDADESCTATAPTQLGVESPAPSRTALLRNTGTGFVDSTDRLGAPVGSLITAATRFADIDGDGWQDLIVAGAGCSTTLLRNDSSGGFIDATASSGLAAASTRNATSVELLDVDADGDLDLFLGGTAYPTKSGACPLTDPLLGCSGNRVLRNDRGRFTDATDALGLGDSGWSFGAAAVDLNLDGSEELVVANGLRNATTDLGDANPEDALYRRSADSVGQIWVQEDGRWPSYSPDGGLGANAKAVVPVDIDGDGRVDLVSITPDGTPRLLRNETDNDHGWAAVRLSDPTSPNHEALGAVIQLELDDGTRLVRQVSRDGSFQSGRTPTAWFGLGGHDVRSLRITWPDGATEVRSAPAPGAVTLVSRQGG